MFGDLHNFTKVNLCKSAVDNAMSFQIFDLYGLNRTALNVIEQKTLLCE